MTSPATMRLVGLLVIVGMVAGCGGELGDAPPLRLGTYHQANFLKRDSFTLQLRADGVDIWHSVWLGHERLGGGKMSGSWTRHEEWLLLEMHRERSAYFRIVKVVPEGLEIWHSVFRERPDPICFPDLPEWIRDEEVPERRALKRESRVTLLTLSKEVR